MPKNVKDLSPHDELQLRGLLRRSDALVDAFHALERGEWGSGNEQHDEDTTLVVLADMIQEADEAFDRAKREAGLIS